MDIYKHVKLLTETAGPSGKEERIGRIVQSAWEPYVDQISMDIVGNVIAEKNGSDKKPRPRILVAAHMDEIGLIVKGIVKNNDETSPAGFLRISPIGGIDRRQLFAQSVTIHSDKAGDLPGVIGCLPVSLLPDVRSNKVPGYDDLLVDVGMSYESLKEQVSVGDFITFKQPLRKLLNERVAGKALDNRVSLAVLSVCLHNLSKRQHSWDIYALATVQEEITFLGAFTSSYSLRPDLAIAVDVTFGKGLSVGDEDGFDLNGGAAIGIGPHVHPGVFARLQKAAQALEMSVKRMPHSHGSGTDAYGLQIAREGVPTGVISVPLRYMHTPVETLALRDIERAGRLLEEFITNLDANSLQDIADEMME
jgi:putative aminopeptidase FrvX